MKTIDAETPTKKLLSIQRVVVAVDLSKHSKATARYAAKIAKCFDASLYVAHVFSPASMYEMGAEGAYNLIDQERGDLRAQLEELASQMRKIVPVCEPVFLEGEAAEQITELAGDVDADLIVTASHHPKFLGRLFNLDQAPKIMHRAPCPVLVYHEETT
jgi:Universal stress protein UspA and related nucleotide-binding proteins